ncbi:MAG: SDH family Clp fold serine proteinase [Dehalococcoidia bacterium]
MPTWGEILTELQRSENRTAGGGIDFDRVRRKYLARLHSQTGRAVILYATAFTEPNSTSPAILQVGLGDVQGFMEAVSGTTERELDLILHSPGGSAEAAESIIEYLRQRYDHIRVFVPLAAMSAATMMALGADEIVLGKHSQLGPIDPQLQIVTPEGPRVAPAKAILDQFEKGKAECAKDSSALAAWLPILRSYAPGLLSQCEDSRELAETMVRGWLERYMFKGEPSASADAARIAAWFADYDNFASHSRAVGIAKARAQGLKVQALEDDQTLQDSVLSVFHATTHTFTQTGTGKIIENHLGRALIMRSQAILIGASPPSTPSTPLPGATPAIPGAGTPQQQQLSRADRRRQTRGA